MTIHVKKPIIKRLIEVLADDCNVDLTLDGEDAHEFMEMANNASPDDPDLQLISEISGGYKFRFRHRMAVVEITVITDRTLKLLTG